MKDANGAFLFYATIASLSRFVQFSTWTTFLHSLTTMAALREGQAKMQDAFH